MTFALLAALILVNAGWLWLFNRTIERHREETQTLLQRIQAPEVAVIEHASRHAEPDETIPMSDEEQMEELERAQGLAEMERLEAEAAPWLS